MGLGVAEVELSTPPFSFQTGMLKFPP